MTRGAVIVPDGDEAGVNAAVTAGAIMMAAGLEVRVARMETGADPDSAARTLGAEKFRQVIENAVDYFVFLEDVVKERQPTLREQEDLIERIMSGLSRLDDKLRFDVIAKELARALSVDVEGLQARHARSARTAARLGNFDGKAVNGTENGGRRRTGGGRTRVKLERLALRLITEGTPASIEAIDSLDTDDFTDPELRKFYKLLDLARKSHIDIRSREVHQKAEEAGLEELAAEIALIPLPPGNIEILLKDTIRRIKELNIRDELSELRKKLHELPPESEEAVAVAEYYYKLKQALVEL
jgi:DNA primase